MRFIRYIIYLMYTYYQKGPKSNIAYFSALCSVTFITMFHIGFLLLLLKIDKKIPGYYTAGNGKTILVLTLVGTPIYFLYKRWASEKKLLAMQAEFGYEHWDK